MAYDLPIHTCMDARQCCYQSFSSCCLQGEENCSTVLQQHLLLLCCAPASASRVSNTACGKFNTSDYVLYYNLICSTQHVQQILSNSYREVQAAPASALRLPSQLGDDGVHKAASGARAANVGRLDVVRLGTDGVQHRALEAIGEGRQVEVAQHHGAGEQRCAGVGHPHAGNVLRHVACPLLKDCHVLPHVHSREQAGPPRQPCHLSIATRSLITALCFSAAERVLKIAKTHDSAHGCMFGADLVFFSYVPQTPLGRGEETSWLVVGWGKVWRRVHCESEVPTYHVHDKVAIQVGCDHHIKLLRLADQLHACVVHDHGLRLLSAIINDQCQICQVCQKRQKDQDVLGRLLTCVAF